MSRETVQILLAVVGYVWIFVYVTALTYRVGRYFWILHFGEFVRVVVQLPSGDRVERRIKVGKNDDILQAIDRAKESASLVRANG